MATDFNYLENLDKISNLPQLVTDEILKRMPIKDAVKTSVLSTKWRYRWTSIPELVFDRNMKGEYIDEDLGKIVNTVLLLHNAVISKFVLYLKEGCTDVDRWIVVLSRSKMFYHLVLAFIKQDSYKVPSCLFSCESLRTLKLEACILRLPSQYKGFSHLTELELKRVGLTSETFNTLIAKIPLLKKLNVSQCCSVFMTHINVHAPNLEVIQMEGSFESINFHNTQNLIKIDLSLPKVICWVDQVHGGGNELQGIDVNVPNIESFPTGDMPEGLHTTYRHLKCANLSLNLEDSSQISEVLFLCKISPCLEKLEITADGKRESVHLYEEHFWDERLLTENVFHHLKTVRLSRFIGVQHELGFIQFILLSSLALETFDIFWRVWAPDLTDNKKLYIVQKMMQFQRASRNAKVMFHA